MPDLFLQDDSLLFDDVSDALAVDADCCCCVDDCDDCCTGHAVPNDIVVDLGSPGLTPGSSCNSGSGGTFDCTDITGEFTLTDIGSCQFEFVFDEATGFCDPTGIPGFDGNIEFLLTRVFDGATCGLCYWRLNIILGGAGTDMAIYESTHKHFVENDCTLDSPVTLSITADSWGNLCSGTMPPTITIEAAP